MLPTGDRRGEYAKQFPGLPRCAARDIHDLGADKPALPHGQRGMRVHIGYGMAEGGKPARVGIVKGQRSHPGSAVAHPEPKPVFPRIGVECRADRDRDLASFAFHHERNIIRMICA